MAPTTIIVKPQTQVGDGPLKGAFPSLLKAALDPGSAGADWARGETNVKVLAAAGDKNTPRNFVKTVEALARATGIAGVDITKAFTESSSIDLSNQAKVAKVALRLAAVAQERRAASCAEAIKLLPRLAEHGTLFKGPAPSSGGESSGTPEIGFMTLAQVNAALAVPAQFSAALVTRRDELTKEATGQGAAAKDAFEKALAALDIAKASTEELEALVSLKKTWEEESGAATGQEHAEPDAPAGGKGSTTAQKGANQDVAAMAKAMMAMVQEMPTIMATAIAAASAITIDDKEDDGDGGVGGSAAKRRKTESGLIGADGRTGLSTYMQASIISPRLRKSLIEGGVDVTLVLVAEGLNGYAGPSGASSKAGYYRADSSAAADGKMELVAVEADIKDTLAPQVRLQAFFHLINAIDEIHPDIGIFEYKDVIMSLMVKYDMALVWTYDRQARFAMANQLRDNFAFPGQRALLPRMALDDILFKTVFNGVEAIRCVFCSSKTHWSCEHSTKTAESEKKTTAAAGKTGSNPPNPHGSCYWYNDLFKNGGRRTGKLKLGCKMSNCPHAHRCFKCGGDHTISMCTLP